VSGAIGGIVVKSAARTRFGIAGGLLVGLLGHASAQEMRLPELSLGYQVQRFSGGSAESLVVPRWANVDLAYPVTGVPISIVGQFDFGRKAETDTRLGTDLDLTWTFATYGFGVRWSAPAGAAMRPFLQVLGGAQRFYYSESLKNIPDSERNSDSGTDALVQVGGGVAVPLSAKWSLVGQIDYRRIFDVSLNNVRFVGGFRLGIE
jgi:hypothetical protein